MKVPGGVSCGGLGMFNYYYLFYFIVAFCIDKLSNVTEKMDA